MREVYSTQNSSVVGHENLSPNVMPAEFLNVTEQIQGKNPVLIVNSDEKATHSQS